MRARGTFSAVEKCLLFPFLGPLPIDYPADSSVLPALVMTCTSAMRIKELLGIFSLT